MFTHRAGQEDVIISNAREDDCADDQHGDATHLQAIISHSAAFRCERENQFYQKDEVEGEENVFERRSSAVEFGFHPFSLIASRMRFTCHSDSVMYGRDSYLISAPPGSIIES